MSIQFEEKSKSFILQTENSTYVIQLLREKLLSHVYWGAKIKEPVVEAMIKAAGRASFNATTDGDREFSLDTMPNEYPAYGNSDLRMPAYQLQLENGSRITDLVYESYKIVTGKPAL